MHYVRILTCIRCVYIYAQIWHKDLSLDLRGDVKTPGMWLELSLVWPLHATVTHLVFPGYELLDAERWREWKSSFTARFKLLAGVAGQRRGEAAVQQSRFGNGNHAKAKLVGVQRRGEGQQTAVWRKGCVSCVSSIICIFRMLHHHVWTKDCSNVQEPSEWVKERVLLSEKAQGWSSVVNSFLILNNNSSKCYLKHLFWLSSAIQVKLAGPLGSEQPSSGDDGLSFFYPRLMFLKNLHIWHDSFDKLDFVPVDQIFVTATLVCVKLKSRFMF